MGKSRLKTICQITILIISLLFIVSPTTFIFGEENKVFENNSTDNAYHVVIYKGKIYTAYSLYKMIIGENYFFVVYDSCGRIIFKPSVYFGIDKSVVYGGFEFSLHNKNLLFYPTNDGVSSVVLKESNSTCQ